jgi:DNA-binding NtrC family response regulator
MPDATSPEELIDVAVLDDDLDFGAYIEDFLKSEGLYAVRTFASAGEFFEGVQAKEPDIVLLDLKMGEVRGETVLEQLLAERPNVCVIVVTGYPSLENMRATFKLKVFDYLAKPFSLAQLRNALNNATEAFGFGRSAQDILRERLGHRIKLMRVERDWSLKDLAAAAKLSISLISAIERGANMPSVESLLAISKAFGKRPSEILAAIEF